MRFFDNEYVFRFSANGGGLRWYALLITLGVILAFIIVMKEFKRRKYKTDDVYDFAFWIVLCGIIGARLYYVIWQWSAYSHDLWSVFYIWEGGLAIYGAIIGGFIALCVCAHIKKYKFLDLTDIIIPGLALAQGIGRWGNFFNQEAYGMPVTNPKWQFFPIAVNIPKAKRMPPYADYAWFQATFFYESMACLLIFALLYFYRKKQKFIGELTLWYFFLYGIERSIVEGFRTDSLMWGNVRVSQLLSMILVVASAVILVVQYIKYYKNKNNLTLNASSVSDT